VSIGFKVQTASDKKRALQIIKNDYFLKNGQYKDYVVRHRKMYFDTHLNLDNLPCRREELFIPCDDRSVFSYDMTTTPGGKPIYTLFCKTKGFWKLRVIKSSVNDLVDFTISVLVGNKWRYYPPAIKRQIVSQHGLETYNLWRQTVLGDLDSLRSLIGSLNLKEYAYSVTCCDSAKRLCMQVGLEVQSDIAFLLPKLN